MIRLYLHKKDAPLSWPELKLVRHLRAQVHGRLVDGQ